MNYRSQKFVEMTQLSSLNPGSTCTSPAICLCSSALLQKRLVCVVGGTDGLSFKGSAVLKHLQQGIMRTKVEEKKRPVNPCDREI